MNLIEGGFGKRACTDLSAQLREMADAVDRGEVVDFIAAFVRDGTYEFILATSLQDQLVLATLMQSKIIDRYKVG